VKAEFAVGQATKVERGSRVIALFCLTSVLEGAG
jgi:hypothetical protein